MTYPGDTSLSDDIQERILATYNQALDLTESGSRKEAILGCDFVLRLDPLFEPARVLNRRLRDSEDEIEIEDLRAALGQGIDSADEVGEPSAESDSTKDTAEIEAEPMEPNPMPGSESYDSTEQEAAGVPPGDVMSTFANEPVDETDPRVEVASPLMETPQYEAPPYAAKSPESTDDATGPGAAPQLDSESQRRIQQLLGEGQDAFDAGEYQTAIDSWSRVFLIDIDHADANGRIEEARLRAAEAERQIEEIFHEAMSHLDGGDLDQARVSLNKVLNLQPGHLAAQEYLDRMDAGDVTPPEPDDAPATTPAGFDLSEPDEEEEEEGTEDLFTTPDATPGPPIEVPRPEAAPPPPAKRQSRRTFMLVGSLVLALVVIGGWFLIDKWDSLFPNSESAQGDSTPQRIDPIARAKKLHEQGKTAIAVAQLRRLPPGDPHYAEAQALVAAWETADPGTEVEPENVVETGRQQRLVERARTAVSQQEYLLAYGLLERAEAIAPLEQDVVDMRTEVEVRLEPLSEQITVFRGGDWEYALPTLWRMREADITNADVNRLIIDSYYNLGVRDLQRGRPEAARTKFEEALNLRPEDRTLQRLLAFSTAYEFRDEDLLYRIFVKYLPFR